MAETAQRSTIPQLLGFLNRETRGSRLRIIVPSVAAGLARGALLAAFNAAAAQAGSGGGLNLKLAGGFAAALVVYLASAYLSAVLSDNLVRRLLHRLRLRICGKLIHAPLRLVEAQDPGKIFTLIGHKWLQGEILTVKQVATYFEAFTSDVTITRHIDDMVVSGTLVRTPDPKDRRRLLLMPTQRLFEIGRIFLEARKAIARRHGYVYDPARAASGQ